MKLRPGHSKTEVRRAFAEVADRLTGDIPPDVRDLGVSYVYLSQDRTAVDQAVRQVTQPTVAALTVFGLVAGAATLAVTALAFPAFSAAAMPSSGASGRWARPAVSWRVSARAHLWPRGARV
jgi:hypothetical protein